MTSQQPFGGDWTKDKLARVRKYLDAYVRVMKKQPFHTIYVDAFAGTGYQSLGYEENPGELLLPELAEQDARGFLDGSARQALQVVPEFSEYIFIEKNKRRANELEKLKTAFPSKASKIKVENEEANKYIADFCENRDWRKCRAVMFLDPFGMQVVWDTIQMIAATQAIDMWYLFPLGVAVNRLLRKDGEIDESIRIRLNEIFGTTSWYDAFYRKEEQMDLFGGSHEVKQKNANFKVIGNYFIGRLKEAFGPEGVANNPLLLPNSRNVPLYLLCFAAGNPNGAKIAIKIADHILKSQ
jgi:three-Cys-motif partner protein